MNGKELRSHVAHCLKANSDRLKPASKEAMLAVLSDRCKNPKQTIYGPRVFWREWFPVEEAEYMRDYLASVIK